MGVTKQYLDNGIEWIADYDPDEETFRAMFYARLGSEKERKDEIEALHRREHLSFLGTSLEDTIARTRDRDRRRTKYEGETRRTYCRVSFSGRHYTKKHHHNYSDILKTSYFALTNPIVDQEQFAIEQEIIEQELEMRRKEDRWVQTDEVMDKQMFGNSRYGLNFVDSITNNRRLTMAKVESLRQRLFRPQNLTVITVGKRKNAEMRKLLNSTFGTIQGKQKKLEPYEPSIPRTEFTHIVPDRELENICFVQHTLRAAKPSAEDMATLYVLHDTLAEYDSSILYRELRLKRGKCYTPVCIKNIGRPEMRLDIRYECKPSYLPGNFAFVKELLEQLSKTPLPASELQIFTGLCADEFNEEMRSASERAQWYGLNSVNGLFIPHQGFAKMIRAVKPKQLQEAIKNWLPGMGTVALVPPKTADDFAGPLESSVNAL